MKERFKLALALLAGLALAAAALLLLIFFWGRYYPLPYSSLPPVIQPAGTPADLGELTARVKNIEDNQAYNMKVFEWKLDQKLLILGWMALFISFAAGFVGIKTYNDLDKVINEEVRRALDKALYHLDPTNLRIWVVSYDKKVKFKGDAVLDENGIQKIDKNDKPLLEIIESNVSEEMKKVNERILLTGLLNIKPLGEPDQKCFDGVTVVPIFDLDMEKDFRNFLDRNKENLDPKRAAFVLYTREYHVSQTKTLAKYVNLALANMLPTITSTILTVGRGLTDAFPSPQEEAKK